MGNSSGSWRLEQAACEFADERGEEVARLHGLARAPIDPFRVIEAETALIHAEGEDFGDAFDGRLSYVGPRFLLCYNTKYNRWPHKGPHHPKVRFTVGHELGHFYLEEHRRALVLRGATHASFTEFASSKLVERQADCFAAGLLMPKFLLSPRVNAEPDPDLKLVRSVANEFDVSLTSMLVRWTQTSHFPCASICVREGRIAWGFVSKTLREHGLWRAKRDAAVRSKTALAFERDASGGSYREGRGVGMASSWLDGDRIDLPVREWYAAIPSGGCVMVLLTADESELPDSDD
jgi:hypothetical protein